MCGKKKFSKLKTITGSAVINRALQNCNFAVICLTPECKFDHTIAIAGHYMMSGCLENQ